jgi:HTH-type transcriptional regulator / antitoxin HipB
MKLSDTIFPELASQLIAERKRQGLSRTQAAAVCNVSTSFIRDAESDPGRCSLAKLLRLVNGLGLSMDVSGWNIADETPSSLKTS